MPLDRKSLVGSWEKLSRTDSAREYPAELVVLEGGTYRGKQPPGAFALWDVGTFEVAPDDKVRISTANDEVVAYSATLESERFTLVAPDGTEIVYRRAQ
jgi:hypothetical protein